MSCYDKYLILCSGGFDSSFLVKKFLFLKHDFEVLFIEYNQNHIKEKDSFLKLCRKYNLKNHIVPTNIRSNSKLVGGLEDTYEVKLRNLRFLLEAIPIAESIGANKIIIGTTFDDVINGFKDCSKEYYMDLEALLKRVTEVKLYIPLLSMTKADIIRECLARDWFNELLGITHTCYNNSDNLDDCPSCKLLRYSIMKACNISEEEVDELKMQCRLSLRSEEY